jgi:hypothetical protein
VISYQEWSWYLPKALGRDIPKEHIDRHFRALDRDESGFIDLAEFTSDTLINHTMQKVRMLKSMTRDPTQASLTDPGPSPQNGSRRNSKETRALPEDDPQGGPGLTAEGGHDGEGAPIEDGGEPPPRAAEVASPRALGEDADDPPPAAVIAEDSAPVEAVKAATGSDSRPSSSDRVGESRPESAASTMASAADSKARGAGARSASAGKQKASTLPTQESVDEPSGAEADLEDGFENSQGEG